MAVVDRLGVGENWRMAFKDLVGDRAFHTLQYGAVANGSPNLVHPRPLATIAGSKCCLTSVLPSPPKVKPLRETLVAARSKAPQGH